MKTGGLTVSDAGKGFERFGIILAAEVKRG